MKKLAQLSTLLLLSLALYVTVASAGNQPPSSVLDVTCVSGTNPDTGNCITGMVMFSGINFPHNVQVTLLDSAGNVLDDFTNTASHGDMVFTETLVPAGTYEVITSQPHGPQTVYSDQFITVDPII